MLPLGASFRGLTVCTYGKVYVTCDMQYLEKFFFASQTTIPLRVHLLAPVLPVPPLHTSGLALSTAWVPNSARSASPRWAAGSQPVTSLPRPLPATPPHPPHSLFLHSALPLHSQALPKPFTPITAKPCPHPPSLDMLSGPAAPSHLGLPC